MVPLCLWQSLLIYIFTGPVILQFPSVMPQATEGQGVVFKINISGCPTPKLTWFHNGKLIESDYAHEIHDDGSLFIVSAELTHSGEYKLVATNQYGFAEQDVVLTVQEEGDGVFGSAYNLADSVYSQPVSISCLLYTSPSPRDATLSRMPSSA